MLLHCTHQCGKGVEEGAVDVLSLEQCRLAATNQRDVVKDNLRTRHRHSPWTQYTLPTNQSEGSVLQYSASLAMPT